MLKGNDMNEGSKLNPSIQVSHRRWHRALLASLAAIGMVAGLTAATYQSLAASSSAGNRTAATALPPHPGFADLVAKVEPAVISVRVKLDQGPTLSSDRDSDNGLPFPPGSPLDKFFRQFVLPGVPQGHGQGRGPTTGEGSGFFISADGYAVTNDHVVDHSNSVEVTTEDGKTYPAKVVGTDKKSDLALIKVIGKGRFPYVTFADKSPRIGDWVMVVGNPFGLSETVTAGIVSAKGRNIEADPYDDFIQIDAPVNQGNSGGPAFNLNGEVIGVTTAIYSVSGGSVGIGFAIPAETAKMVIADLKSTGRVRRGWLGAQIQQVTLSIAESLGLQKPQGALVAEVMAGSPAMRAGIRAGDVVMAVNGQQVKGSADLVRKIGALTPGAKVDLRIIRNGLRRTLTVALANSPEEQQVAALGMSLAPASASHGSSGRGVVVTEVQPNSAAAERGLQAGDVILEVGGKTVSTPAEVREDIGDNRASGRSHVLIRLRSGDQKKFVALPVGKA
jgi:serine protease Do